MGQDPFGQGHAPQANNHSQSPNEGGSRSNLVKKMFYKEQQSSAAQKSQKKQGQLM